MGVVVRVVVAVDLAVAGGGGGLVAEGCCWCWWSVLAHYLLGQLPIEKNAPHVGPVVVARPAADALLLLALTVRSVSIKRMHGMELARAATD